LRRKEFLCIASGEVEREAGRGDAEQARRRLEIIRELTFVEPTPEAEALVVTFLATGALPANARADAAHLALATVGGAD